MAGVSKAFAHLHSDLFIDRLQSQEEIAKLIDYSLKDKDRINMAEFKAITESVSSPIFLCVSV